MTFWNIRQLFDFVGFVAKLEKLGDGMYLTKTGQVKDELDVLNDFVNSKQYETKNENCVTIPVRENEGSKSAGGEKLD